MGLACVAMMGVLAGIAWAQNTEETARRIQEKLMAPCCWSESVAVHRSESAATLRTEIARQVREGRGEKEILDAFVAQYGERILMEPRGGKSQLLDWMPLAALAIGGLCLALFLARKRRPRPALETAAPVAAVRDEELDW